MQWAEAGRADSRPSTSFCSCSGAILRKCSVLNGMLGDKMPQGDGEEAEDNGQGDVHQGAAPRSGAKQIEGLQAEGGERRKASAEAHHDKEPGIL